jgi:hypothetical protein
LAWKKSFYSRGRIGAESAKAHPESRSACVRRAYKKTSPPTTSIESAAIRQRRDGQQAALDKLNNAGYIDPIHFNSVKHEGGQNSNRLVLLAASSIDTASYLSVELNRERGTSFNRKWGTKMMGIGDRLNPSLYCFLCPSRSRTP